MNKKLINYCILLPLLYGCSQKSIDAGLVDFSGTIFIIFILIILCNLLAPLIVQKPFYEKFHNKSKPFIKYTMYISIIFGLVFLFVGIRADGLNKIYVFLGFIAIIMAFFIYKYIKTFEDKYLRSKYVKIIGICVSFGFTLFFIIYYAKRYIRLP